MLLRLSVSNYLSLLDTQELSLVAGKLKAPADALRFPMGDLRVLPAALIYGPNASGKSNLIAALAFMRAAVLHSHTRGDPSGGVPRMPFAFDPDAATLPSMLEADFTIGDVRYQFGFEAMDDRFTAEWLYVYPDGKRRKFYERTENNIVFGPSMKGQKKLLAELMRSNSLFLSTATQNDHEELSVVRKFFAEMIINQSIWVGDNIVNSAFQNNEIDDRTITFLGEIGTGVAGYRRNASEISDVSRAMLADLDAVMRKHIAERGGTNIEIDTRPDKHISIELAHQSRSGTLCYLDLDRESAGTRRLLLLINTAFRALDSGSLLVIDEVDASLHTRAAEAILALFDDPKRNRLGAQLIATAHDTNLLASPFLGRDQIWFTEKNQAGETDLFSLAEIRTRPTDNFEVGYLQGRYGGTIAVPSRHRHQSVLIDGELQVSN